MKIAIASGKGGVGKSMIASCLSILFSKEHKIVACDCDVDAPNLAIWLKIKNFDKTIPLKIGRKAFIINQKEINENAVNICKYGAFQKINGKIIINQLLCEGCGLCKVLFPKAIEIKEVINAEIRIKEKTQYGFPLISAQLYPGEKGSGKIVFEVRRIAENYEHEIQILDCAAGLGCPVNACLNNVDFALLVTEPTKTAISDLKRVILLVEHFKIPYRIIINKWDLERKISEKIEKMFTNKIIGKVSHNKKIFEAVASERNVLEIKEVKNEIERIYERLKDSLSNY